MKKWKTLRSRILLEHPRIKVYEDEVELPDGRRTQYLKFDQQVNGAFVVAKNSEGKILVVKEYNYPPDTWLYHFPGGGFGLHEQAEAAALRELSEEVGLTAQLRPLGWFYYDNRKSSEKMYYFVGEQLEIKPGEHDVEEEFEEYWLDEEDIDRLIRSGEVTNYSFLAGWSLYKAHKG